MSGAEWRGWRGYVGGGVACVHLYHGLADSADGVHHDRARWGAACVRARIWRWLGMAWEFRVMLFF